MTVAGLVLAAMAPLASATPAVDIGRVLSVPPSPAFVVAVALYGLSLFLLLAALSGRKQFSNPAMVVTLLALLAHGTDIGWRGVLNVHPAQSVREALGLIGFLLTLGYLLASLRQRIELAGVVVTPVALVMLLVARLSPTGTDDPEALSGLLRIHISLATFGVAVFALASVMAVIYLLKDRSLRGKRFDTVSFREGGASLESVDRIGYVLVWLGFPIFTLSLILGAVWVAKRGLPVDRPEYPIAIVTWACYAALLGARQVWGWRGRRSAKLTLAGFGSVLLVLAIYLVRRAIGG